MASTAPKMDRTIEDLTLNVTQEIHVHASLEATFAALLEQLGPQNDTPDGKPMPMKIEPWPGGPGLHVACVFETVDCPDVRMIERCKQSCFAFEARHSRSCLSAPPAGSRQACGANAAVPEGTRARRLLEGSSRCFSQ